MQPVETVAGPNAVLEPIARLVGATVILDDRPVLRRVDLDLSRGITVLRGHNGAGKTTALRALAGVVRLARGEREVPEDILYLGHRPQLLHGLTAREDLTFFSEFRAASGATGMSSERAARIDAALERWGLDAAADRPVERLSAGQRRRAALARLETESCSLVLLDEPFAELDADAAGLLRGSLADATRRGAAILIASHGHAELDDTAVRVYQLREGEIATAAAARS